MKRIVLVAVVLEVALTACGQKGALYLPKRGTVVTRPAGSQPGANAPAAPTPDAGAAAPAESSPQAPAATPSKPDDKKDDDKPKPQN